MQIDTIRRVLPVFFIAIVTIPACSGATSPSEIQPPNPSLESAEESNLEPTIAAVAPTLVAATPTVEIVHVLKPTEPPTAGKLVYDVVSEITAPEKRAPYGDSYDINLFERPFLQDMTYIPDLDIFTYTVTKDANFWYVSVELIGTDPNNTLGINYGLELDTNYDGFGDYIIWTHPPYESTWDTLPIQIFQDKNHDTGGLSSEKSDAPFTADGYETLVFDGGLNDADPDIAWVRIHAGRRATVQFAFKRSWSGMIFMLGVVADAGLTDVRQLDYVDRFEEQDAGSPVKEKPYYPLGVLFAVDNTCREAFGLEPNGLEPRICPPRPPPTRP